MIGAIKERLEEVIKEVSREMEFEILALKIQPDHVRLFISTYSQLGCHKIVLEQLKGARFA